MIDDCAAWRQTCSSLTLRGNRDGVIGSSTILARLDACKMQVDFVDYFMQLKYKYNQGCDDSPESSDAQPRRLPPEPRVSMELPPLNR